VSEVLAVSDRPEDGGVHELDLSDLSLGSPADIERRRNRIVFNRGFPEWPIRSPEPFTLEEVETLRARGQGVPLDLMPSEFWWPEELPFPRFGEEMLGKDF
jgi:hypothetical protein